MVKKSDQGLSNYDTMQRKMNLNLEYAFIFHPKCEFETHFDLINV
jgi:hypothetical protein